MFNSTKLIIQYLKAIHRDMSYIKDKVGYLCDELSADKINHIPAPAVEVKVKKLFEAPVEPHVPVEEPAETPAWLEATAKLIKEYLVMAGQPSLSQAHTMLTHSDTARNVRKEMGVARIIGFSTTGFEAILAGRVNFGTKKKTYTISKERSLIFNEIFRTEIDKLRTKAFS